MTTKIKSVCFHHLMLMMITDEVLKGDM